MEYEKCTSINNNKIISLKENKSEFRVSNKNQKPLRAIQVDGCLVGKESEKCDWLVICDEAKRALFIELKGCDIEKAISQLATTLRLTRDSVAAHKKECYIVCTRYPKTTTSSQERLIRFFKANKATLSIKSLVAEVEI